MDVVLGAAAGVDSRRRPSRRCRRQVHRSRTSGTWHVAAGAANRRIARSRRRKPGRENLAQFCRQRPRARRRSPSTFTSSSRHSRSSAASNSRRFSSARLRRDVVEFPAQLAVTCIGYEAVACCSVSPTNGVFANENGKVEDRLYVVGWAKRGPSGTIPTNRTEAQQVAQRIAAGDRRRKSSGRCWVARAFGKARRTPGRLRRVAPH